ncbi:hypothetical protein HOD96_02190 [Candidatus Falkowbacteria bacterium]|jgi:hypothetical protein|nr:hypothetical protein [Candidatus Falkowbacteria bacterium]MBT4433101.1 hypothetical protein [Candidatus Falkowbacteria bacterium]
MTKIISIFFILLVFTGCSSKFTNSNKNYSSNSDQFLCTKDSDCVDCCNGQCVNYEWWKKNGSKIECKCKTSTCVCINNECANK